MVYGLAFDENCGLNFQAKWAGRIFFQTKEHQKPSHVVASKKKSPQNHAELRLVQAMAHLEEKRRELLEVFWPIFFWIFGSDPKDW